MKDIDLICITVDLEYERTKRWYDHLNYCKEDKKCLDNMFYKYI